MTDKPKDDSNKLRFEAGMLEFVRMQQRIEEQCDENDKLIRENHLLVLERDKLTFDLNDLRVEMRKAADERSTAVAHRIAYETLVEMARKIFNEFTPPTPAQTPVLHAASETRHAFVMRELSDKLLNESHSDAGAPTSSKAE